MFTRKELADYIFRALDSYEGDDLERAELSFKDMSSSELDKLYGSSGKTVREILDMYRENRRKHNQAVELVETLRSE